MNTTLAPIQQLQAGQACALAAECGETLIVIEGDVLVRPPAQWIAETVVQEPPRRIEGPARVALEPGCSVVALGRALVAVERAPVRGWARLRWAMS